MPEIPVEFKMKFDLEGAKRITREMEKWKRLRKEMGGFGFGGAGVGGVTGGGATSAILGGAVAGSAVSGGRGIGAVEAVALAKLAQSTDSAGKATKELGESAKKAGDDFKKAGDGLLRFLAKWGGLGAVASAGGAAVGGWQGMKRLDEIEQWAGKYKAIPGERFFPAGTPDRARPTWAYNMIDKYGGNVDALMQTGFVLKQTGLLSQFRRQGADAELKSMPAAEIAARITLGMGDVGVTNPEKVLRHAERMLAKGAYASYADFESFAKQTKTDVKKITGVDMGVLEDLEINKATKSVTLPDGRVVTKEGLPEFLSNIVRRRLEVLAGAELTKGERERGLQSLRDTITTYRGTGEGALSVTHTKIDELKTALGEAAEAWTSRSGVADWLSEQLEVSIDLTDRAAEIFANPNLGWGSAWRRIWGGGKTAREIQSTNFNIPAGADSP